MSEDMGSPNYVEYSVVQKPNGKTMRLKAIIVLATVAVAVALLLVIYIFAKPFIMGFPLVMVLAVFVAFQFWKYTNVSFDYTIAGGELKMCAVYGGRKRTELFETRISSAEAIVACNGTEPAEARGAAKVFECVSEMSAPDIVCIVFKDDAGNKCAAYFEAQKKAKTVLKFYNSTAYKVI